MVKTEPFFDTELVSPLETSNINYSQAEDFFYFAKFKYESSEKCILGQE